MHQKSTFVFEISIPTSKKVNGHTEYQFILISNIPDIKNTYTRTFKRYSEVLKLHKKIYKAFPRLPAFPKKVWFGRMSPVVIENRRKMFEVYFEHVFSFIIANNLIEEGISKQVFSFFNKC